MPILNSLAHAGIQASKGAFLGFRPFISSVNLSSSIVNEGSTLVISINTVNVPNYTSIAYTITGINSADVSVGDLTGSLNILNNQSTSSISLTFVEDYTLEGDETITMTFTLDQRATYVAQATLADFSRPSFEISYEPPDTSVVYYGNTSFTVGTTAINSGSDTYTYKWQRSTNSGVTWNDITDGAVFSGTTTNTLIVEKWNADLTSNFHNALFRCIVKDAVNLYTLTTRAASLTVTSPPYGAVVHTTAGVSRTWTVPSNVYAISAVLVAGGGGGGGSIVNPNYWDGVVGGGGGGAGTVASGLLKVVPGETLTLYVGSGGSAGSTSTLAGNGENTSISFSATGSDNMSGSISAVGGGAGGANSYGGSRPLTTLYRYGSRGTGGTTSVSANVTSNRTKTSHSLNIGGAGGLGAIAIAPTRSYYMGADSRAGGGAAGYSGRGGGGSDSSSTLPGNAGVGGGGGGGAGCGVSNGSTSYATVENGGGGISIFGEGVSGAGGLSSFSSRGGGGGSGGASGSLTGGGLYGGGGQAGQSSGRPGGQGALRLIFGLGTGVTTLRSYAANTDTANTSNTVTL